MRRPSSLLFILYILVATPLMRSTLRVPPMARINIEHERGSSEEEIEFPLTWQLDG